MKNSLESFLKTTYRTHKNRLEQYDFLEEIAPTFSDSEIFALTEKNDKRQEKAEWKEKIVYNFGLIYSVVMGTLIVDNIADSFRVTSFIFVACISYYIGYFLVINLDIFGTRKSQCFNRVLERLANLKMTEVYQCLEKERELVDLIIENSQLIENSQGNELECIQAHKPLTVGQLIDNSQSWDMMIEELERSFQKEYTPEQIAAFKRIVKKIEELKELDET